MADNHLVDVLNDPQWRRDGRYFGKYRGIVQDNKDPDKLGRILATVPAISAMAKNWALPCSPYAGKDVGLYTIPPVGAKVWIEFEGGDPTFPIWSGCFWQKDEPPTEIGTNADDPSQVKILKTRVAKVWIDDTDQKGQMVVQFNDSTVDQPITVTMTIDSTGIKVECAGENTSTVIQTPDDISTDSQTLATTTAKDTTLTVEQNLKATVSQDLTMQADGKADLKATGNLTLEGDQVAATAQQAIDLKGMNATLEATSAVTAKGATAEVNGSGTTTIKGGMVNIN